MSLLSVSAIENTGSPTTNIVLGTDGSVTIGLYRGGTAPTPVQTGTLWYDTTGVSGTTGVVIWNGSAWVGVGGGAGTVTAVTASLPLASTGGATPNLTLNLGLGTAINGSNIAVSIPVASTPPAVGTGAAQALNGSLYWDDTLGSLFIRYNNGGTPTWVQTSGQANVITTNATYYVATTGNDTTGNGSLAAPWATPHRAMEYLSAFVIKQGVTVTVSVADGAYTFTTPLNLNHPNGSQIFINGGTTSGVRPTTSLTGGNAVGNTGATLAANDLLLNAYYNTRWQFNGCHGLVCTDGGNVTVNTVLIRGDGSSVWSGIICGLYNGSSVSVYQGGVINLGSTVAVHNFGGNGVIAQGAGCVNVSGGGLTVTNSGQSGLSVIYGGAINGGPNCVSNNNNFNGLSVSVNGSIAFQSGIARYNGQYGVVTSYGGSINAPSATASNNGSSGITTQYGGSIEAQGAAASNNGANGIVTSYGGSIQAQGATVSNNGSTGVSNFFGGNINIGSGTVTFNGLDGVASYSGGPIAAQSVTSSNNTRYGIITDNGGSINAAAATVLSNGSTNVTGIGWGGIYFTGGNAAGSLSPAANTIGNGNSIIIV
jgi:hypothetical protein